MAVAMLHVGRRRPPSTSIYGTTWLIQMETGSKQRQSTIANNNVVWHSYGIVSGGRQDLPPAPPKAGLVQLEASTQAARAGLGGLWPDHVIDQRRQPEGSRLALPQ